MCVILESSPRYIVVVGICSRSVEVGVVYVGSKLLCLFQRHGYLAILGENGML